MAYRQDRRKKIVYAWIIGIVVCCVIAAACYGVMTYKGFYVSEVVVQPDQYQVTVERIVQNELEGKTLYLFPSRHMFFIPKSHIIARVRLVFPEVSEVLVIRSSLTSLQVEMIRRNPVFKLENGLGVDEEGVVYSEPKDMSKLPTLSFVGTFPKKEELTRIRDMFDKLSKGIALIESIDIDEYGDARYFFNQHNSFVSTKVTDDASLVWSTLLSAIDTSPLATRFQNNKNDVEYIDLRFGNKVFYKFRKDGLLTHASTTTSTTRRATTTQ